MRKKVILILSCIICLLFVGELKAENKSNDQKTEPQRISGNDLKLGNLEVGMEYEDVMSIMKTKPIKVNDKDKDIFISLDYADGTSIVLSYGMVQVISVKSRLYPTPRGLAVGDKKEKAFKLYGEPDNGKYNDSNWQYNMGDDPVNFSIFFKGNKINGLEVLVREI